MTFWQFIQAHALMAGIIAWFLYTCAVNALPPEGQPFVFSVWLMAFMREIAQQAPKKFPTLTPAQMKMLATLPPETEILKTA